MISAATPTMMATTRNDEPAGSFKLRVALADH
jgi:hypothetical protein